MTQRNGNGAEPFLEIVTRHYTARPDLMYNCRQSVARQSDRDFAHRILIDEEGRGVAWANGELARHNPKGRYVWVLDDDDLCTYDHFVRDLKALVEQAQPHVVMVKNDLAEHHGILPDDKSWRKGPHFAHVSMSCFVVSREVWLAHRRAFAGGAGADYRFLQSVWESLDINFYRVIWWDQVVMRIQRRSLGAPQ